MRFAGRRRCPLFAPRIALSSLESAGIPKGAFVLFLQRHVARRATHTQSGKRSHGEIERR
jgi:hypothetical protein